MKKMLAAVGLLIATTYATVAATTPSDAGYRDCDLHHLEACRNTNQMFVGMKTPGYTHGYAKKELPAAIKAFLAGAPKFKNGRYTFTASQTAIDSLWGPGQQRTHFAGGAWFFDGFTPHYGPNRAAIIFNPAGKVIVMALLNREDDHAMAAHDTGAGDTLRIYSHDAEPMPEILKRLRDWASHSSLGPGFPLEKNALAEIRTYVRAGNHWSARTIP